MNDEIIDINLSFINTDYFSVSVRDGAISVIGRITKLKMENFVKAQYFEIKELKDLVAGDEVVAYDKYDNRRIAIVERITKTLVVVNNIKYRKSDGFASGESYIFSRRIEIPKDEEQIKAIKLEYRKRIIIHRIHNLNLNDYPLEVLEKVYIELGGN